MLCPDRSARSTQKAFHVYSTLVLNSQLSHALMIRRAEATDKRRHLVQKQSSKPAPNRPQAVDKGHMQSVPALQGTEAPAATHTRPTSHLVQRCLAPTFHASRTDGPWPVLLAAHAQTPINPPLNCLEPDERFIKRTTNWRRTTDYEESTRATLNRRISAKQSPIQLKFWP